MANENQTPNNTQRIILLEAAVAKLIESRKQQDGRIAAQADNLAAWRRAVEKMSDRVESLRKEMKALAFLSSTSLATLAILLYTVYRICK